jgi:hypothetical protein
MDEQQAAEGDGPSAWSGEERLVLGAILLVASRAAPRVTVAGLRFGDMILESSQRRALAEGVRVLARRTTNGACVDLVVEALR